ncbi:MAG: Leader peptidase (Prepilin peptidase) / N-methyltransferase, partial [Blastococcus sp.]|nr:Leader peptidase (Prepilin peptidase) / N-methyltransferase [Blastococcus sp.]
MDPPRLALLGVALLIAIALGPWLARVAVRLAAREETGRPSAVRTAGTTALLAGLL